jgi:hypothetical protein
VVQLLGGFDNIAFPQDLTSRPGFATASHLHNLSPSYFYPTMNILNTRLGTAKLAKFFLKSTGCPAGQYVPRFLCKPVFITVFTTARHWNLS